MTKIAYNSCYGGFGISDAAVEHYLNLCGKQWTKDPNPNLSVYHVDGKSFDKYDIPRTNPNLIATIETLGEAANTSYSNLKITELPSDTKYRIDEYDGHESVMTIDDYEWSIA